MLKRLVLSDKHKKATCKQYRPLFQLRINAIDYAVATRFFNLASNTNGPNGNTDAAKPIKKMLNGHFCTWQVTNNTTKNNKNNTPCAMPTVGIMLALSNMYFIGIATNNNSKNEMPSKKPTMRNNLSIAIFQINDWLSATL